MNFALAPIFSNDMVFQTGKPIRLFGVSQDGARLTLEWFGKPYIATPTNGTFRFDLPKLGILRSPFCFSISDGVDHLVIHGCLSGDVFLAGGQSNMQFILKDSSEPDAKANDLLRFYQVPQLPYPNANDDFPAIYAKPDPKWQRCSVDSAGWFSAIGYHVGQSLQAALGIPIGIVSCNQGDTSVFSWTPEADLETQPSLRFYLEEYRGALSNYASLSEYDQLFQRQLPRLLEFYNRINQGVAAGLSSEEAHTRAYEIGDVTLPMGPKHHNRPGGMFETMVKTILPFALKGVFYYQGESDHQRSNVYAMCFKTMVDAWRKGFEEPFLPVVAVQLAGYSYPGLGENGIMVLRDQQVLAACPSNHRYLVSAIDQGETENIHPRKKKRVAERIANLLLERVYGIGDHTASPVAIKALRKGMTVTIQTHGNSCSLKTIHDSAKSLRYSVDGKAFLPVEDFKISGTKLVMNLPVDAKFVDYAYQNAPQCDLFTENDLPLLPFLLPIEAK
jgi:sialate O-acetylesterase